MRRRLWTDKEIRVLRRTEQYRVPWWGEALILATPSSRSERKPHDSPHLQTADETRRA